MLNVKPLSMQLLQIKVENQFSVAHISLFLIQPNKFTFNSLLCFGIRVKILEIHITAQA